MRNREFRGNEQQLIGARSSEGSAGSSVASPVTPTSATANSEASTRTTATEGRSGTAAAAMQMDFENTDREDCEIASQLEIQAEIQRSFAQSQDRVDLYSRWKALNISSKRAASMPGLDWVSFMFYNASAREVIDELFDFFEEFLLQPMHGHWMQPGALRKPLPPNSIRDAIAVGIGEYAKLSMYMYMVGAYVDAFHPGESVSRMECPEDLQRVLQDSAREAVSAFETLVEHMGHGRLPSSDMVGHFPSVVMTYATQSIRTRVVTNGSAAAVAKEGATATAARDWYIECLDEAAEHASRLADGVYEEDDEGGLGLGGMRRMASNMTESRLAEEWESVERMLKSYRAMLAGTAGGSRVVSARSVSILPYLPFQAYAVGPQRVMYESVIMRGMQRAGLVGEKRGRGGVEAEEAEEEEDDGAAMMMGDTTGMVILPNPIDEDIVRGSMMHMTPTDGRDLDEPMSVIDKDCMSWEESRSRLGPSSLVAARRAFRLFRDAYWGRFEDVGDEAGVIAGEEGMATEGEEDDEEGGGSARMTEGARAARVLKDLVCSLREVLLIQGGSYSYARLKEDKTIEHLEEVVQVGLTGRTLPGKKWDGAVVVIRSMFRYLMLKCSLLSPSTVLDLHRGRELRMALLEQLDDPRHSTRADNGALLAKERRRAMLDALRFLVETVQRIRWDADNERLVRLSPLLARCAPYVLRQGVSKYMAKESVVRRKSRKERGFKCYVCEPPDGENDGMARTRAFLAQVCREEPDRMRAVSAAAAAAGSSSGRSGNPGTVTKPGAEPRVRICVVSGVVRHVLGAYLVGDRVNSQYHQYDRDGRFLSSIPEEYSECAECMMRGTRDAYWLPETLSAFDDMRLKRLKRRFHFVARLESILAGATKYFHESFRRTEPNFQTRVQEATRVLLSHVQTVVEKERGRGWGAWSAIEMRAVLRAAIQFRASSEAQLPFGEKDIGDSIVGMIMDQACPVHPVFDTMLKRRIRNAEKILLEDSRWGREEAPRPAKRARTESGAMAAEAPEDGQWTKDWLRVGLRRARYTPEELFLDHDGCEVLAQTWTEVLHESSLVIDLTLEVSGDRYKRALDELFQRTSGLHGWERPWYKKKS